MTTVNSSSAQAVFDWTFFQRLQKPARTVAASAASEARKGPPGSIHRAAHGISNPTIGQRTR